MNEFLKKVELFQGLPDSDLEQLSQMIGELRLPAGEVLFREGDMGDKAYIVKDGQIEITKGAGKQQDLLAVISAGGLIGEMSFLEAAPRTASGRALTDTVLLAIGQEEFDRLINSSPTAAKAILKTSTARLRATELVRRQSEKMAQLSTMTSGVAHELNNPAAALHRSADQLVNELAQLQAAHLALQRLGLSQPQIKVLCDLGRASQNEQKPAQQLDALERSDRQVEIEGWLESRGIENGWELAPTLVNMNFDLARLADFAAGSSAAQVEAALKWLGATDNIFGLLEEIRQTSGRINRIVQALKTYVYADQAPLQMVNIVSSLQESLDALKPRLSPGVAIQQEFPPELPLIQASPNELKIVWTKIIENALDAVQGQGVITLRARSEMGWIFVEIEDSGTGIAPEVQSKVFDPFFTTKPIGEGAGLGLNIAYNIIRRYTGEIKFFSQPGRTVFEVRMPIDPEAAKAGSGPLSAVTSTSDEELRAILEKAHNIAVVGISGNPNTVANSVPAYLHRHGYTIYPVNPNLDQFEGVPSYGALSALKEPIDIVLVFRRSEFVPPIVDQAISIGAKAIWMQEGIVNEAAANSARQAGLEVVMDTCIRATHKRLFPRETAA